MVSFVSFATSFSVSFCAFSSCLAYSHLSQVSPLNSLAFAHIVTVFTARLVLHCACFMPCLDLLCDSSSLFCSYCCHVCLCCLFNNFLSSSWGSLCVCILGSDSPQTMTYESENIFQLFTALTEWFILTLRIFFFLSFML